MEPLGDYFDENYVSGRQHQQQQLQPGIILNVRHLPHLFPPVIWNDRQRVVIIPTIFVKGGPMDMQLVGHSHPSFWKSIESIRKEEALNRISIINGNHPSKKLRQTYVDLQQRAFAYTMQRVPKQQENI